MTRGTIASLQARRDRALRDKLVGDVGVGRALRKIEQVTSGFGFRHRRELLSGALRLTRAMAPGLAESLAACRETLGVDLPIEVYVKPDPRMNAFCAKNPAGPIVIGLSSRLLEVFEPAELRFVLGHELGHVAYDHFGIPMPLTASIEDMAGILVSRQVALELYVWCRAAEVSADRAGLLCAAEPDAGASAIFKLASGLPATFVKMDLDAFISQASSLASVPAAWKDPRHDDDSLDCFSTHPFSPLRVRALAAFARSRAFAEALGRPAPADALSMDDLEAAVERDLQVMEPTYLEDASAIAEQMRRLLFAAGVSVAAANGTIAPAELKALRALLGSDRVADDLKVDDVRRELEGQLDAAAKDVPLLGRAQLLQHLTIVAAADGLVEPAEVAEMHRIAGRLGVDPVVIEQTLAGAAAPMD